MATLLYCKPHQTHIVSRENSVVGTYNGNPWNDRNYGNVRTWWDVQDCTYGTHDHKEHTYWLRHVGSVREVPLIAKRVASNLNVVDTFWMSRNQPDPYAWSPSDRMYARMGNQADKVDTEALLKLSLLRDGAQAQFGASLAEAKTTLDMFAGVVIPPVKFLLHARRGQMRQALEAIGINGKRTLPRDLSALWLQYVYGVKPLIDDVYAANKLLNLAIAKPMTLKVKHSRKLTNEYSDDAITRTEIGRNGIGIECEFEPSDLHLLRAAGLTNPASVAWEVVPFSFVVDWFVPVGNTLQALTATADLSFIRGSRWSKIDDHMVKYDNGNPQQQVQQRGEYEVKRMKFNRVPMNSFPTPKIYANENPLSTPRIANALALVTQLITGR